MVENCVGVTDDVAGVIVTIRSDRCAKCRYAKVG